jgi:hypothetical protein
MAHPELVTDTAERAKYQTLHDAWVEAGKPVAAASGSAPPARK